MSATSDLSRQDGDAPFAAGYPPASRADWRELAAAVLRRSGAGEGADVEDALSTTTYDGITIRPLYTDDDAPERSAAGLPGHSPFVRGATTDGATGRGWDVRQRHTDPDPQRTNRAALEDLAHGVTSLWLVLGDGGIAVRDLPAALDGVYLDLAPIILDAGRHTREAASAFLALAAERGVAASAVSGTLGADPIGLRARTGAPADTGMLAELAAMSAGFTDLRVATVDGTAYHDGGASDTTELAVAASVGVAYLRALTGGTPALSVDAALAAIEFRYAVGADQFLSIAKLRAARRIWDRVAELSAASPDRVRGQRQHAVTSAAMLTRRDPWANLLRTTIACFAAAIGGAEAITVAPFDAAIGLPDDFARRLARNTQSILHDEASLARVIDAAGGSWYVESVTDAMADKAWEQITAIERAGGALAALEDGTIAALVAATRDARAADVAHRRAPIIGVTQFALPDEVPLVRRPSPPSGADGPIAAVRYAQDFEALRDRADAAAERPTVFLAALGPFTAHGARLGFARNLFQAAGIDPVVGTGEPDDLVTALRASGSSVVCLCSSDKVYAQAAASEAAALKAAGAAYVWLAGRPGDRADSDESAGIDGYLFAGCDALDALRRTLDVLGVAELKEDPR
jgi:methylmalonyl-CoA mutase